MQSLVFDAIVTEVLERPSPTPLREDKQYVSVYAKYFYILFLCLSRIDICGCQCTRLLHSFTLKKNLLETCSQ